jgi:hypothetical protein
MHISGYISYEFDEKLTFIPIYTALIEILHIFILPNARLHFYCLPS